VGFLGLSASYGRRPLPTAGGGNGPVTPTSSWRERAMGKGLGLAPVRLLCRHAGGAAHHAWLAYGSQRPGRMAVYACRQQRHVECCGVCWRCCCRGDQQHPARCVADACWGLAAVWQARPPPSKWAEAMACLLEWHSFNCCGPLSRYLVQTHSHTMSNGCTTCRCKQQLLFAGLPRLVPGPVRV
jgi:hypothetical protein